MVKPHLFNKGSVLIMSSVINSTLPHSTKSSPNPDKVPSESLFLEMKEAGEPKARLNRKERREAQRDARKRL